MNQTTIAQRITILAALFAGAVIVAAGAWTESLTPAPGTHIPIEQGGALHTGQESQWKHPGARAGWPEYEGGCPSAPSLYVNGFYIGGGLLSNTKPLYRLYQGPIGSTLRTDHFYTTSTVERDDAISRGYSFAGIPGFLFTTQQSGTVPLYRLEIINGPNGDDHLYTTRDTERDDAISRGYTFRGVTGYLYRTSRTNTVHFYRLYKAANGLDDHLYTTDTGARDRARASGYTLQETTYIPSTWRSGTRPLYQFYIRGTRGEDRLLTVDTRESDLAISRGYISEGVPGYLYPTEQPNTVPLYRLYINFGTRGDDHFYTRSAAERDDAVNRLHYTYESVAGYLYPTEQPNTVPLYRLYSPPDPPRRINDYAHLYTTDPEERQRLLPPRGNWVDEGITGYIYPSEQLMTRCREADRLLGSLQVEDVNLRNASGLNTWASALYNSAPVFRVISFFSVRAIGSVASNPLTAPKAYCPSPYAPPPGGGTYYRVVGCSGAIHDYVAGTTACSNYRNCGLIGSEFIRRTGASSFTRADAATAEGCITKTDSDHSARAVAIAYCMELQAP